MLGWDDREWAPCWSTWCVCVSWRDCPYCGPFYRAMRGRPCVAFHQAGGYPLLWRKLAMGALKSKPAVETNAETQDAIPSSGVLSKLPLVWEYLTKGAYEDGTRRVPSKMQFFVEAGVVKVSFQDHDNRRSCFYSGSSIEEVLKSVEKHLDVGDADWRAWPREEGQGRKRR